MIDVNVADEKKKALIFSERKTTVHISKINGLWNNGIILEIGNDFFIIKDRLDGRETLVLFSELDNPIEIYKEKEE
jgi:hypothetical protein